jgi:hypothetical protein
MIPSFPFAGWMFAALGVAILAGLPLTEDAAKPERSSPVSIDQGRRSLLFASTQGGGFEIYQLWFCGMRVRKHSSVASADELWQTRERQVAESAG